MIYDILEKKKNKKKLTKEEIDFVVENYCNDSIKDYQMSSLLMAIAINGMDDEEITNLTMAMAKSGEMLHLNIENTVDKHSTGGVGDKTTLIIAPIVACLNCKVVKMSGKALGYTGGTIDKLESINTKTKLTQEEFIKQVNSINLSIISQTEDIAKADKKIYALRDVTATVESIPLIASSVMSKKIASGAKNLVLDIKTGNGAFMKNESDAVKLGQTMVNIGKMCNINTISIITDMNEPLGNYIGNLKEIYEAIEVLKGNIDNDLRQLSIILATYMHSITNKIELKKANQDVLEVLNSKKAYYKFLEMLKWQNADLSLLNQKSKYEINVYSKQSGYITFMDTEKIGKISCKLGSGRINKHDEIDYTAGIKINYKLGDYVKENDVLCVLYTNKELDLTQDYLESITISEKNITKPNLVKGIIQ